MTSAIFCATKFGNGAKIVSVEGSFTRGLPSFNISGLANHSIQEAKHRVQSALYACQIALPPMKFVLNLSPADLPKTGSHFDLPIALLGAKVVLKEEWFAFGELGLDGKLKHQDGVYPLLLQVALSCPNAKVLLPKGGENIFSLIPSLNLFFVSTLQEAIDLLQSDQPPSPYPQKQIAFNSMQIGQETYYYHRDFDLDFADVLGQEVAKRAALIAASGFHNIILEGSPGCGKSMIAKRLRFILPPMRLEEILECTKLQSLDQSRVSYSPLRPFRNPHQSASKSSILGSATATEAKAGGVALAHLGVLFFDELPHFKREVLESLREPLENNSLVISRVHSKIEYETLFLFIGAQNPCPCGNLLSTTRECRCQDRDIVKYRNCLSEPFLDRIDLFVQMADETISQKSMSSEEMQERVFCAFRRQKERGQIAFNGKLNERGIEQFCVLDEECQMLLTRAIEKLGLSHRAINRLKKVARTIADLEGSEKILKPHLTEAIVYRKI